MHPIKESPLMFYAAHLPLSRTKNRSESTLMCWKQNCTYSERQISIVWSDSGFPRLPRHCFTALFTHLGWKEIIIVSTWTQSKQSWAAAKVPSSVSGVLGLLFVSDSERVPYVLLCVYPEFLLLHAVLLKSCRTVLCKQQRDSSRSSLWFANSGLDSCRKVGAVFCRGLHTAQRWSFQ